MHRGRLPPRAEPQPASERFPVDTIQHRVLRDGQFLDQPVPVPIRRYVPEPGRENPTGERPGDVWPESTTEPESGTRSGAVLAQQGVDLAVAQIEVDIVAR